MKPARQATSSPSFTTSPVPMLVSGCVPPLQSGRTAGEVMTLLPGAALLSQKQLPVLPGKESHHMSRPLGRTLPLRSTPKVLPVNLLPNDVDTLAGSQPGTGVSEPMGDGPQTVASGTAKSIVPRR